MIEISLYNNIGILLKRDVLDEVENTCIDTIFSSKMAALVRSLAELDTGKGIFTRISNDIYAGKAGFIHNGVEGAIMYSLQVCDQSHLLRRPEAEQHVMLSNRTSTVMKYNPDGTKQGTCRIGVSESNSIGRLDLTEVGDDIDMLVNAVYQLIDVADAPDEVRISIPDPYVHQKHWEEISAYELADELEKKYRNSRRMFIPDKFRTNY